MKKALYSVTALLLAIMLFVGCTANEVESSQTESVEASEALSDSEGLESSEVISAESGEPEAESSLEDKFAGIASFDTEFNEDKVIYYDGYMDYTAKETTFPPSFETVLSTDVFASYKNADNDDWFVVALALPFAKGTPEYDGFFQILEHIGAIEITDHPFLGFEDYCKALSDAKADADKDVLKKERFEKLFPGAEYGKDPYYAGVQFTYIGYFTKPMLNEADNATDACIACTFMPEIGNNECWFKNLRK